MFRSLKLALVAVVISAVLIWAGLAWQQRSATPKRLIPHFSSAGAGTPAVPAMPAPIPGWGFDRTADIATFRTRLQTQAKDLIAQAANLSDDSLAALVRKIPTAALLDLQAALDHGDLSAAISQKLQAALAANQNRLKLAQTKAKTRAWYAAQTLDLFDERYRGITVAWVKPARVGIEAFVRKLSADPLSTGDDDAIMWRLSFVGFDAGCRNGVFLYFAQRIRASYAATTDNAIKGAHECEAAVEAGNYPVWLRFRAALDDARFLSWKKNATPQDKLDGDAALELAKQLLPQVLADPTLPRVEVLAMYDDIANTSISLFGDRQKLAGPMLDVLKQSAVDRSTALTVEGRYYIDYGWDARGTGFADTVTAEGARLLAQRLGQADAALEEAWRLDPTNVQACNAMINVELGQGLGRDRMELWFQRAMDADPDNLDACWGKLNYIEPKWYGSYDAMIEFGRQLVAGGNYDAGLPTVLIYAYQIEAQQAVDAKQEPTERSYFENHPEIWKEIQPVYANYLAARPPCQLEKLRYAQMALWCGQYSLAKQLFEFSDTYYDTQVFPSAADGAGARAEARDKATPDRDKP